MNAGMAMGDRGEPLFSENGISYGMCFLPEMLEGATFSKTHASVA